MNSAAAPDRSAAKAILTAAFVAGTLDILAAFALYALLGVPATRILQSIAAGLLGPAAFEGAARTAWLGLGLHFAIMTVSVGVYYLASRFLAMLRQALDRIGSDLRPRHVRVHDVHRVAAFGQSAAWVRSLAPAHRCRDSRHLRRTARRIHSCAVSAALSGARRCPQWPFPCDFPASNSLLQL